MIRIFLAIIFLTAAPLYSSDNNSNEGAKVTLDTLNSYENLSAMLAKNGIAVDAQTYVVFDFDETLSIKSVKLDGKEYSALFTAEIFRESEEEFSEAIKKLGMPNESLESFNKLVKDILRGIAIYEYKAMEPSLAEQIKALVKSKAKMMIASGQPNTQKKKDFIESVFDVDAAGAGAMYLYSGGGEKATDKAGAVADYININTPANQKINKIVFIENNAASAQNFKNKLVSYSTKFINNAKKRFPNIDWDNLQVLVLHYTYPKSFITTDRLVEEAQELFVDTMAMRYIENTNILPEKLRKILDEKKLKEDDESTEYDDESTEYDDFVGGDNNDNDNTL
ncbi:MAG: hypothetical protein ACPGXY_02740 [Alphaproteobacteria bacterium]